MRNEGADLGSEKRMNRWRSQITTRAGHGLILEELFDAMDAELLSEALYAVIRAREADWTDQRQAQHVWDHYCGRYLEKHGAVFPPDLDPKSSLIPVGHMFLAAVGDQRVEQWRKTERRNEIVARAGHNLVFEEMFGSMDQDLLKEALAAALYAGAQDSNPELWTEQRLSQYAWDHYCDRYYEEYRKAFLPDVKPNWSFFMPAPVLYMNPLEMMAEQEMAATEVVAQAGHAIKFANVDPHVDVDLHREAVSTYINRVSERGRDANATGVTAAQYAWNYYCDRHREMYGKPYPPDISPRWSELLPAGADSAPFRTYIDEWTRACGEDELAPRR